MRRRRTHHSTAVKLSLFVAALAAFYGSYYLGNRHASIEPRFLNFTELRNPQAVIVPILRDQYGNPFDHQQLLGHWSLVIFGYTEAAESLRSGLTLITQVKNGLALQRDLQRVTRGILITVDPDTDRPEVLNAFMARYSPDYLALTGSPENIQSIARSLGVVIKRSPAPGTKGFRIDHSSSIALINPDADLIGLFTGAVDAASIAADITRLAMKEAE